MFDDKKIEILKKELNLDLDKKIIEKFDLWEKIFIDYNSHTNLMSKNDVSLLFEKHVFDSLTIFKWEEFFNNFYKNIDKKFDKNEQKKILDVGTGGGFPSVILAIALSQIPEIKIIANDSRIKKINFIKEIKEKLNLENLEILYSRIEESKPQNVDLIVSRAVGKIKDIWELSNKHLKKDGYFLIYKSKTMIDEIEEFKVNLKQKANKKTDSINEIKIINYNLPLKESYERNLVIYQN